MGRNLTSFKSVTLLKLVLFVEHAKHSINEDSSDFSKSIFALIASMSILNISSKSS